MGTKATHHIPEHSLTTVEPMGSPKPYCLPMPHVPIANDSVRTAGRPSEVPPKPGARRKSR